MGRPVTLFTGQWADLSLNELAPLAKKMGFDGLELACWGDHFDVYKAAESGDYCRERWRILTDAGLSAFAISNHLVGQAIAITSMRDIEGFSLRKYGATATRKAFDNALRKT